MKLFGFEIKRPEEESIKALPSFIPDIKDDGASVISAGGSYGVYVDLDGSVRTESELVSKYRDLSMQAEIEMAIDNIINDSVINEENQKIVELILNDTAPISPQIKELLQQEFQNVLNILEFNEHAYEIYKRWYIDGRLYYHVVIDPTPQGQLNGILKLRYIDPRKIRKVREIERKRDQALQGIQVTKVKNEYYIYNERGFTAGARTVTSSTSGIKIAVDSICHCTSGLMDPSGATVIGYLHSAIKPMNQLRALEDATLIYRISRAPERRIFYIDVGNLPKVKAEQYLRDMMIKHKNRLVYDSETGSIKDDRKFMCYALDTKIPLLDGRTLSLEDIISEYKNGKKNWVYSCDPITGKFVPGPVSWAGITKRNSQVVKVTFDNGKSVVCTPDHKFPVWGEGFVEAQHLTGKSIIPGYRRMQVLHGTSEYEQIYKNDTKKWEYTHREVVRWKAANFIREEKVHKSEYEHSKKNTIHHVDYNRLNNAPSNLVMMNRDDHYKFHWDNAKYGIRRKNKSEDFTPAWRQKLSDKRKGKVHHCKSWSVTKPDGTIEIVENLNEYCRANELNRSNIKYKSSKGYKAQQLVNHKAISVEFLTDTIDVGCLTIDLEERYHSHHTYLLDAGVYTKNTMLEDYWLPRREGGRGTEITTLPAGQNLGELSDVEYFQKRLFRSLRVPFSRLDPEAMYSYGRVAEITRDEINFARFIDRLRMRFSTLFTTLLEKQLVLKQIMSPDEFRALIPHIKYQYARDNLFSELKQNDIMQARLNVLNLLMPFIGKYFSHGWIRKNVLKQSDEDMQFMDQEIAQEINIPQYISQEMEEPQFDNNDKGK